MNSAARVKGRDVSLPEHIVASNKFGSYCVPASSKSRPAAAAILAGKVWEPRTVAYMTEHCGAGDIVHAGAYFGDFIPALSKGLRPGARLWAFEPSSENYACARRTIELNGVENTTLMHAGLGASAATGILRIGRPDLPAYGGTARFVPARRKNCSHEEAQVVAVDEVVPDDRTVSILQLDVEGFEQQALTGALRTIARCRPKIILENLPKDPDWFDRTIISIGYTPIAEVHANTIFAAIAAPN
jgi:FkbM family methyltransferase